MDCDRSERASGETKTKNRILGVVQSHLIANELLSLNLDAVS